jgi:hypothetical protein
VGFIRCKFFFPVLLPFFCVCVCVGVMLMMFVVALRSRCGMERKGRSEAFGELYV